MAYERFRQQMLARKMQASSAQTFVTASLNDPIRGVGKLPAGSHVVTITAVDTLWLTTRGYLELTLTLGANLYQRHKIYLRPRGDSSGWSFSFRLFMRALLPSSAHAVFLDAVDRHGIDALLQVLRGFSVGVRVTLGQGYTVEQTATGYLRIYNGCYDTFDDLPSLLEDAQARGLPKATLTLKEFYDAGTSNANANALRLAVKTLDAANVQTSNDVSAFNSTNTDFR